MSDTIVRIKDLPAETELSADDCLVIDNATDGLRKIVPDKMVDKTLSVSGMPADAGKVNDLAFLYRNTTGITDLDDMTEQGYYALFSNIEYTHIPDGVGLGAKHLIVLATNTGYYIQRLYVTKDNSVASYDEYVRVKTVTTGWNDWKRVYSLNDMDGTLCRRSITGLEDLNDATEKGYYILASNVSYTHMPDGVGLGAKHLVNFENGGYLIQRLYITIDNNVSKYDEYVRIRNNATNWNGWKKVYSLTDIDSAFLYRDCTGLTDFNDMTKLGYYALFSNINYDHMPVGVGLGAKHIINIVTGSGYLIQRLYVTIDNNVAQYDEYVRVRNTATNWNGWRKVYSLSDMENILKKDNIVSTYTSKAYTDTEGYTGKTLRILSYNVARYNKDTSTYINDEKRFNIKKMLSDINPDLVGIQEDGTIDGGSATAGAWIFSPTIPVVYGASGCTIRSKMAATQVIGILEYSNGRGIRAAMYTIDSKKVLFCCTHPGLTPADRAVQYEEMFQWVTRAIVDGKVFTMRQGVSPYADITCPNWDYCIIAGDMNSTTEEDHETLTTLAENYHFRMANGGWLGWIETCRNLSGTSRYAIDNIICSDNVVINSVKSFSSLYDDLHSDHYPFFAEVTLKD